MENLDGAEKIDRFSGDIDVHLDRYLEVNFKRVLEDDIIGMSGSGQSTAHVHHKEASNCTTDMRTSSVCKDAPCEGANSLHDTGGAETTI